MCLCHPVSQLDLKGSSAFNFSFNILVINFVFTIAMFTQRILIQEQNSMGLNFYGKSRNLSNPVMIQGGIDTSLTSFVVRNVFIHYVELFFRIKKIYVTRLF